jgi:hypothetical protein
MDDVLDDFLKWNLLDEFLWWNPHGTLIDIKFGPNIVMTHVNWLKVWSLSMWQLVDNLIFVCHIIIKHLMYIKWDTCQLYEKNAKLINYLFQSNGSKFMINKPWMEIKTIVMPYMIKSSSAQVRPTRTQ